MTHARNFITLLTIALMTTACQVGKYKEITRCYDEQGRLTHESCREGYEVTTPDGVSLEAEVNIAGNKVTVKADGKTQECTPKNDAAMESLKRQLEGCTCPDAQSSPNLVEAQLLEGGEPGGEGTCSTTREDCPIELDEDDWTCRDV